MFRNGFLLGQHHGSCSWLWCFLWVDCACDHTHVDWNWDVHFELTHLFKANRARIIHLTICLNWSLSIRIWVNINDHDGAIVKRALYLQLGSWIYADYLTHRISWSFCWKAIINHGKYRNVNFGGHVPLFSVRWNHKSSNWQCCAFDLLWSPKRSIQGEFLYNR